MSDTISLGSKKMDFSSISFEERTLESHSFSDESSRKPSTEQHRALWEALLGQVKNEENVEHPPPHLRYPTIRRAKKLFPTGSNYDGSWDVLGMSGFGIYTFSHGVIYEGEFHDGTFHGEGQLKYPNGIVVKGKFCKGSMIERTLIFSDNVEYKPGGEWVYCKMPDRRFSCEYGGLSPAGRSILTATQPPHDIPEGFYDTEDGLYDPKNSSIFRYDDPYTIIRTVKDQEHVHIIQNCRKNPMGPLGPEPALYEKWSKPMPYLENYGKPKQKTAIKSQDRVNDGDQVLDEEVELSLRDFLDESCSSENSILNQA